MTKIIFNKSHKIIAAVMALVLCFSAFLWIAPQVQAEELDISDTSVTGFTTPGTLPTITNGNLTGGSIGVFVTSTTGDRYRADNVKWTYNYGDWEFDGDSKVIFENNDEKQQIAAYYPYTETTNGSVAITLPEAYDANYDQYDYLYGEYDSLSSNPAIIRMEHLMAKVTVNVQDRGTEVAGDNVKSIALADVPRTATWTLPGDTLSEYGDGELIVLYGNGSSYTGYALPTEAEDLTLRITMESGRIFTATVSLDDLTTADKIESLEGGVHYRFGLKVGKDAVTLSSVTVSGWADGGTIDGGVATEVAATLNAAGYYEIGNADQLFWFAQQVNVEGNKEIKGALTADIDLKNKPWTPIGAMGEENSFRGVFDGQNYTIRGLNVEGSENGVGFFGEVRTGTVKNFTIYGEVVVNTEVDYVGGVIGSICGLNGENDLERNGAVIQNITSYVNVTAKAHGIGMIGGFVGYADHQSLIEKCSWYGTFNAGEYRVDSGAGGFIGKIQENTSEVTIRNCGAYGTIKTNYAKNSYNNTATIYMGGFLSLSNTGAKTTLENCLFAGKFERGANLTDEAFLGAFGTLRSVNAIKNCYYLGDGGLAAVHSDSPLNPESDNVEITKVTEDDLRGGTITTQLGEYWEQGEHYPVIKK